MTTIGRLKWLILGVSIASLVLATGALIGRTATRSSRSNDGALVGDGRDSGFEGPGLRIDCRNDDECIKTSEVDWKDGAGPLQRRFLRVRIYNDGPRTLKGCCVTLHEVTEVTPNGDSPTEYDGPCLLIWSGDRAANPEGKNILGNARPEVADLFYTVHHPSGDQIQLKDQYNSSVLKFGRWYAFEVIATSDDASAVSRTIKVRFGPRWDDFEVVCE